MQVISTVTELSEWVADRSSLGQSIGLVPTMGALHEGHLSIVRKAKAENDVVVVTVFVNPTQFNNSEDLRRYPRDFDADRSLLVSVGADIMFHPSVEEVYPEDRQVNYDLDGLDTLMEGAHRPGHFSGVVQVVNRFFELISPANAYFGEKDFQQLAIIRHMTKKLGHAVNIVGCPTVREQSGLAMSSRNMLLTPHWRQKARVINQVLQEARDELKYKEPEDVVRCGISKMEQAGLRPEYFELIHPDTLSRLSDVSASSVQACIAAWAADVRLIDNMRVK
jgi:pantoate--beta-alanine ligase